MMQGDSQSLKVGVLMTKEEQKQYDRWSKMQIYEAYMLEEQLRKDLARERNELRRKLAEVRYLVR